MYLPPRIDRISLGLTYCRSSYELDRNQYLLPEEMPPICKAEVDGPTPTEYTSTPLSLRDRRTLFLYASESLSSFHGPPDITTRIYVKIINKVTVRTKVLTPNVDGRGEVKEWGQQLFCCFPQVIRMTWFTNSIQPLRWTRCQHQFAVLIVWKSILFNYYFFGNLPLISFPDILRSKPRRDPAKSE